MLRKSLLAGFTLVVCVGITLSEEIRAVITKVDGNNVTFAEVKGKGKRGEEKTLPVATNAKITKGKFNTETKKLEAGDPLTGGLKAKAFTNIGEKGLRANITISDDGKKITAITVAGGKKKKNQ